MQQLLPQKHRTILTEQQAIEIFGFRSMNCSATFVAKRYGINERTVRDIWKQRTWTHATRSSAEGEGPITKRRMGRPVGSQDMRPRKQKLAAGSAIVSYPSTPFIPLNPLKCHPMMPSNAYQSKTDFYQDRGLHDKAAKRRLFSSQLLESSDEVAIPGDRSPIEDGLEQAAYIEDERLEREEEASIDDQLHAWADRGTQWILTASLPLTADSPWACEPSSC